MSDQRIIFTNPDGTVGVIIPAPGVTLHRASMDIPPEAVTSRVVPVDKMPRDRLFRAAWRECPEHGIREDFDAARECAHGLRRKVREAEFAPHDATIAKAIPGETQAAEAARQSIREKYVEVQGEIDAAADISELRFAVTQMVMPQ